MALIAVDLNAPDYYYSYRSIHMHTATGMEKTSTARAICVRISEAGKRSG